MRRYRHKSGAVLVIRTDGVTPVILPAWCNHIEKEITRADAAQFLFVMGNGRRDWRRVP